MVGHDQSISHLELAHATSDLYHLAGNLVAKDRWLCQLLKPDLVNIGKADPTSLDLKQQIPFLERGPGNLLNSGLMVLRNKSFHEGQQALDFAFSTQRKMVARAQ